MHALNLMINPVSDIDLNREHWLKVFGMLVLNMSKNEHLLH